MKKLLAIFGSFGLITTASGNLISCNNPSDKTGTVKTPSEVAADFTSTPLELKINNQGENFNLWWSHSAKRYYNLSTSAWWNWENGECFFSRLC
jgi:hypothetical protein